MERETEFQLYQVAEDQAGYFTLAQARKIGLRKTQIYRELARGKFERATQGVYRFVQFPASRFEEIHVAVLSAGEHAVVGFQSALYVYGLSDMIPDEVHLILPVTSSRRRPGIRVHSIQLIPENVTQFEGLPITTVDKTISDCAFAYVHDQQIRMAVFQSLRRGMTTKQKLIDQANSRPIRVQELIGQTVEEVEL
jgi:predicted transcriptional regulator of viral defense system